MWTNENNEILINVDVCKLCCFVDGGRINSSNYNSLKTFQSYLCNSLAFLANFLNVRMDGVSWKYWLLMRTEFLGDERRMRGHKMCENGLNWQIRKLG